MDIKEIIEQAVQKLQGDSGLLDAFKADPKAALKEKLGFDIPDDAINKVIEGIKLKLEGNKIGEEAEGVVDKIKGFFEKK